VNEINQVPDSEYILLQVCTKFRHQTENSTSPLQQDNMLPICSTTHLQDLIYSINRLEFLAMTEHNKVSQHQLGFNLGI
jgi:hypothetical protein